MNNNNERQTNNRRRRRDQQDPNARRGERQARVRRQDHAPRRNFQEEMRRIQEEAQRNAQEAMQRAQRHSQEAMQRVERHAQEVMQRAQERARRVHFEHAAFLHQLDPVNHPAPQRPEDMPEPTTIMEAIQQNDCLSLQAFLNQGQDPNAFIDGEAALSYAVRSDSSYSIISTLLSRGANPNTIIPPPISETVLVYAVRQGMTYSVISSLLQSGANPNTLVRPGSHSALAHALLNDASYTIISSLLERGASPDFVFRNGDSALIFALRKDMSSLTIGRLLDFHADPNAVDGNGESALIIAIRNNSFDSFRTLVDHGANPNVLDAGGFPVFVLAARAKNFNSWISLLNHGGDINATDRNGWTALMHLCSLAYSPSRDDRADPLQHLLLESHRQHQESMEHLNQLMASMGQRQGHAARRDHYALDFEMDWAVSQGTRSPVDALVNVSDSINVDMAAQDGRTAFLIACETGRIEHLAILENARANCLARTHSGETALHLAAASGHLDVVLWLLEKYPNILYEADRFGRHALHRALANRHTAIARGIIHSMAGQQDNVKQWLVRQTDHDGNSALPMAAALGSVRTVNALLPFASDVEICQAQVATRLGYGNDLLRLTIHHTLLQHLVEKHGWFNRAGAMGPLPRRSKRVKRRRILA